MSEDDTDKPFEASEQRLRRAREKGDIPRSTEVGTALAYIGMALALLLLAPALIGRWLIRTSGAIGDAVAVTGPGGDARAVGQLSGHAGAVFDAAQAMAGPAAFAALAVMAVPAALVVVGLVVQKTLVFTPGNLAFKLSRIDPIGNAKQKFGVKGIATFVMSLARVALATAGGWLLYRAMLPRLGDAVFLSEQQWVPGLGLILRQVLALAVAITVALAGVDILWKRLQHRHKLRMTRQEVEDEHKESEGDPHFKSLRRQRAVDIAMSSMLADVERADVVITNPTHYAVALEWKRGSGRAPVCLAKGTDEVAARIRERARAGRVPIWPDPPCARALHAATSIGDEIPVDQFAAVAAAIRFAEAMRKKAKAGW